MNQPDRTTQLAFVFLVLLGGSNAVFVRFSNLELPPFWGAAIRFATAALIFWIIVAVRRINVPRGRALICVLLFGILANGLNYAFLYYALVEIKAGLLMVVTAFVPLLTFMFALAHGQESFRWRGMVGALIAIGGIVLALGGSLGTGVPMASLAALILSVFFLAEAPVVLKLFPTSHPMATNAVAVTTGAILVLIISLIVGEERALPTASESLMSLIYLVLLGTVVLFYLYLRVLSSWTASRTNYAFLLFPVITVTLAALLLGEQVTVALLVGGVIVLVGVWVGAFSGSPAKLEGAGTPSLEEAKP